MYSRLSEAAQARIQATLAHTQGGQISDKLRRALEEDHLARTLLGLPVQALEARLAEIKRPATPGGPPTTRSTVQERSGST